MLNTIEGLGAQHRSWPFPSDDEIRWLLGEGTRESALYQPYSITACTGKICPRGTFAESADGDRRLFIFRCTDKGEPVDLVAWDIDADRFATWVGTGFCIGDLDDIFNPATYFAGAGLCIHADPISWLKADRVGIVIAKMSAAASYLGRRRLVFADVKHAERVKRAIERPSSTAEILIEEVAP